MPSLIHKKDSQKGITKICQVGFTKRIYLRFCPMDSQIYTDAQTKNSHKKLPSLVHKKNSQKFAKLDSQNGFTKKFSSLIHKKDSQKTAMFDSQKTAKFDSQKRFTKNFQV